MTISVLLVIFYLTKSQNLATVLFAFSYPDNILTHKLENVLSVKYIKLELKLCES